MKRFQPQLGEIVRELRLEKGFPNQDDFADTVGIDVRTLRSIESGKENFRHASLSKIAQSLSIPVGELKRQALERKRDEDNLTSMQETSNGVREKRQTRFEPPGFKTNHMFDLVLKLGKTEEKGSAAVINVLRYLISYQLPWGEWGDRRTSIESVAAERNNIRILEGPKPNVARTLFAIEALQSYSALPAICDCIRQGRLWMASCASSGWFLEWRRSQTLDSDDTLPLVAKLPDIRHTAQAITALYDQIEFNNLTYRMVQNVSRARLVSGFWAETEYGSVPRILASVYTVEALGNFISKIESYTDLDGLNKNSISDAFYSGLGALYKDAVQGGGLLGSTFDRRSSYITGMALYRLARLSVKFKEMDQFTQTILDGLVRSCGSTGWEDEALPKHLRNATRIRTGLRIIAGISRLDRNNTSIDAINDSIVSVTKQALIEISNLDAPDIACLLNCLEYLFPEIMLELRHSVFDGENLAIVQRQVYERAYNNLRRYLTDVENANLQIHQCYQELAQEFRSKLLELEVALR